MKNIIEPSQDVDYDDVFETIYNDAQKRGLSDEQVWEIWKAGIAAQPSTRTTSKPASFLTHLSCRLGFHVAENTVDICHCRCIYCGAEWEENPYI